MISIICVYNNRAILDEYMLKSLKNQDIEHELILVDNTNGKFKSAAEALNFGGKKAKGNYLMFVHQDVCLSSKSWLKNGEKMLNSISNLGIAGVAGKVKEEAYVISNMKQGPNCMNVGISIDRPVKVQTLDECLILIPKSTFNLFEFDEDACNGWHLYAVDYCLTIKNYGFDVYAIPLNSYHLSEGFPVSNDYFSTMKKLINKHKSHYKWISTTIGNWNTSYPVIAQKLIYKTLFYFDKRKRK